VKLVTVKVCPQYISDQQPLYLSGDLWIRFTREEKLHEKMEIVFLPLKLGFRHLRPYYPPLHPPPIHLLVPSTSLVPSTPSTPHPSPIHHTHLIHLHPPYPCYIYGGTISIFASTTPDLVSTPHKASLQSCLLQRRNPAPEV